MTPARSLVVAAGTRPTFVRPALGVAAVSLAAHRPDHALVVRPCVGDGVRVAISRAEQTELFPAAATAFADPRDRSLG
ncbi:hypothetical protein [Pseudonocardia sp. ICBG1293]|uniref:hypothetical protein n=1 Tax=Pseudonocardia sp. ICBG1293 TaxID=2844382 RepID=UPI001CCCE487|nr:hypothetical protein [Pseudonocardia sp. ICBG1293]